MPRTFRLNPQAFLEILVSGKCVLGATSDRLQYVFNPAMSGLSTVVRLDQDITNEELVAHLSNLGMDMDTFLQLHEAFVSMFRN